ncbi:TPA: restriction endonuclease subunit S [Legionella pneumophila]|nr:restriction endonuclease subunit S [Legionella pneumophila]
MTYSLIKLTLEECVEQLIDYRGKTPKKTDSGIPLITAKVIKNGKILPPTEFIAENDYESWMRRGIPKEGDVVLTVEAPLGEVAQLDSRKIALAQRVITLRGKKDLLNNTFLKYLLMSNEFQSALNGRASGTTVLGIKQSELRKIQLTFPHLSIQKKIAHILSTLDNKIELNKKINQTLESIAQGIFKSWFVDFDPVHAKANAQSEDEFDAIAKELGISREILDLFPSEFEESELGLIPKGWSIKSFSAFANIKTKSVKPYNYPEKEWISYSIPAFDSNCYPEICLGAEIKSNKYKVENGAILVSKLNPNNPRVWLTNKISDKAICSTEFMQFVPRNIAHRPFIYCLINSEYFQNEIQSRVTGTTGSRQRAQPKEIAVIPVINPTFTLIDKFSKIASQLLEKALINQEENHNLKQIQKILLPKLIYGELEVLNLNLEPEDD